MDKNRRCILSCNFAVVIVRILSALTGLGLGCAAGWAIYRASIIYNDATANNWQTSGACASGKSQQEFAVFLGLMGVYFVLCGIFIFLAEIRHYRLQVTVLRPFGFLQTWMGRGVFLVIVGSIFINLPVDSRLCEWAATATSAAAALLLAAFSRDVRPRCLLPPPTPLHSPCLHP